MADSKYGNKKVVIDGHKFDSIAESKYYAQLKWLKQAKQIKDFKLQPRFLLLEAYKKNGKTVRKTEYVADFEIHNLDGSVEIVDVKGVETPVFKLKKKMFEARYEHTLKVVTLDETHGWLELEKLQKLKKKPKKVKPNAKKKAATVGYPFPKRARKVSSRI
ncbi:DUF1064 domain-containing protein [Neobacillus sp. MM2021_6]|uniref:DUF1064 domain-containing protein n=1 Tax=Bacillaceae TaxID=186817 RepID=UPI0014081769|nr:MULTISPECIES: DUF1064 domain-containing protein [Bacillaceae]MBO0962367.1 DUF1064 domain-containing protein [Neobacillus sp. MM2021_6]NHC20850.1 DUF1064 domain-containing protein [Bacillus sp. MM2020_4]